MPANVTRKEAGAPARRFRVYRNNVYAGLIDVLAGRFPVVARLVGEEFFRAMARLYVEREPPSSAVLLRYGANFANFIAGFPPAAPVPYLADMAALEWLRHSAYHAADAAALPLHELASAADHAADAVLTFHPSLGIVRSHFPIVSIYELNVEKRRCAACAFGGERGCAGGKVRARGRDSPSPARRRAVHSRAERGETDRRGRNLGASRKFGIRSRGQSRRAHGKRRDRRCWLGCPRLTRRCAAPAPLSLAQVVGIRLGHCPRRVFCVQGVQVTLPSTCLAGHFPKPA